MVPPEADPHIWIWVYVGSTRVSVEMQEEIQGRKGVDTGFTIKPATTVGSWVSISWRNSRKWHKTQDSELPHPLKKKELPHPKSKGAGIAI